MVLTDHITEGLVYRGVRLQLSGLDRNVEPAVPKLTDPVMIVMPAVRILVLSGMDRNVKPAVPVLSNPVLLVFLSHATQVFTIADLGVLHVRLLISASVFVAMKYLYLYAILARVDTRGICAPPSVRLQLSGMDRIVEPAVSVFPDPVIVVLPSVRILVLSGMGWSV